jgi:hypothetical protein
LLRFSLNPNKFFYIDDNDDGRDNGIIPSDEEYGDMIQEPMAEVDDIEIYTFQDFSKFEQRSPTGRKST